MTLAEKKKTSSSDGKPWGNGKATPTKNVKGGDTPKSGTTDVGPMTKGKQAPPFAKKSGKTKPKK